MPLILLCPFLCYSVYKLKIDELEKEIIKVRLIIEIWYYK